MNKRLEVLIVLMLAFYQGFGQSQTHEEAQRSQGTISDTVYRTDIALRMNYLTRLDKEVLPGHSQLKLNLNALIRPEDRQELDKLLATYYARVDAMEEEARATQRRVYNNLRTYSRVNNLILFETLRSFPDSYALFLNLTLIGNGADLNDRIPLEKLYATYQPLMTPLQEQITAFHSDLDKLREEVPAVQVGGKQYAGTSDKQLSDLIDLLFWAIM